MKKFCVVTTFYCNLSCSYCYDDTHEGSVAYVPTAKKINRFNIGIIENALRDLQDRGYRMLLITGGEPFASKDTPLWLDASLATNLRVRILTNAAAIPEPVMDRLGKHPNLELSISIGGGTRETHNRHRGGWDKLMVNLDRLKALGVDWEFSYVLSSESIHEIDKGLELAKKYGVGMRLAALSLGNQKGKLANLGLESVSMETWQKAISETPDPIALHDLMFYNAFFREQLTLNECTMRTHTQVMDFNGKVFGCFFREDIEYGNVFKESLGSILDRIDDSKILDARCFGNHCLTMCAH